MNKIKANPGNDTVYPRDWYTKWFDQWYISLYKHRSPEEAEVFLENLHIWKYIHELNSKSDVFSNWCLDLGCGSGRYAEKIAKKGFDVLALDYSKVLIEAGKGNSRNASNPSYVRADMRCLPTMGPFLFIISMFTSFGYFEKDSEHLALLNSLQNSLVSHGILILDLPNKSSVLKQVAKASVTEKEIDGIAVHEERWLDSTTNRVIKRINIQAVKPLEYYESVRLFTLKEIDEMFSRSGLKLFQPEFSSRNASVWGDYDGSPYTEHSPRMILFGEKIV